MNNLDQRLERVRALFDDFHHEASRLLRDLGVANGSTPPQHLVRPRIAAIQKTVCEVFDVPLTVMASKVRTDDYATPRMVSMMLSRELTTHSLEVIGHNHGVRDHGTVTHAIRSIANRVRTDHELAAKLDAARTKATERLATLDLPLFHR